MTATVPAAVAPTPGVRWRLESWDPGYGASTDEQPSQSKIEPVLDVELAVPQWRPLDPARSAGPWSSVLFVDGVRRIEAIGWGGEDSSPDGTPSMGLFASYAAGVVCCRPGRAEVIDTTVERVLLSGAPAVPDLVTTAGTYVGAAIRIKPDSPPPAQQLGQAVQERMRAAELTVAQRARAANAPDELLVVDGPLNNQVRMSRTLGYAKTHGTYYLPADLNRLVGTLTAGQRTPVFGLPGRLSPGHRQPTLGPHDRYSWYVKLPGGSGAPWAGVVRVECWADVPVAEAIELATASQTTLCRYASTEYKDARAPQNLYPIAGLERELRRRLGDQRLLHRAIRAAAVH